MVIKTTFFLLIFNFLAYSSEIPKNIYLVLDNVSKGKFCVNSVYNYKGRGISLYKESFVKDKFCEGIFNYKMTYVDFEFKEIFLTNYTIIKIK